MRLHLLLTTTLLLAGCSGDGPKEAVPILPDPPVPDPVYSVAIVVLQETSSGVPLPAQVQAVPVNADGSLAPMQVVHTDTEGAARFTFRTPTTLLVRAVGPDGWTQEGARVEVGPTVASPGLTVSDRDVFLPLYRSSLDLTATHAWSTATAAVGPAGDLDPAKAFVPLALPDGLQEAYLARLADGRVAARWTDGAQGTAATLSVGLAWDGAVWVEGNASSPTATGAREAAWDGDLPADRPTDLAAAHLQAALLTRSAIVGDVLFDVRVTLRFGGAVPAGMPADDCHLLC